MSTLPIPQALLDALTYDPWTGVLRWKKPPTKSKGRDDIAGCVNRIGYVVITFQGHQYAGHRVAWKFLSGKDAIGVIDHRDGDRGNNRGANLRDATGQQNAANRRAKRTKTLPKGVHRTGNASRPYQSSVCVSGKHIHLGTFETVEAASAAYGEAAIQHFGEFALASSARAFSALQSNEATNVEDK